MPNVQMGNTVILLKHGEEITLSCGPGRGQAFTVQIQAHQAIDVTCGGQTITVQCQPGNVQETLPPLNLAKNQTVTIKCM